jgi:hypothetical protein
MSSAPIGRGPGGIRRPGPAAQARKGPGPASPSAQDTGTGLPAALAPLQAAAQEPEGPLRDRKLLRAHVEQALLGFFGPRLSLAPRFQDIVDQAVDALYAEPALEGTLQAACSELIRAAGER